MVSSSRVTICGQTCETPFNCLALKGSRWCTSDTLHHSYILESPFWKNKSAAVMRLLILTNAITYIINFHIYTRGTCTCRTSGEIPISDRGPQAPRLRITIKNTTWVTSQCKPTRSAWCQTWDPEPKAGSPQCAVDITTHPCQTGNNTCGKEEFVKNEVGVTGKGNKSCMLYSVKRNQKICKSWKNKHTFMGQSPTRLKNVWHFFALQCMLMLSRCSLVFIHWIILTEMVVLHRFGALEVL